jgi:hypothetical protein
MDYIRQQSQNIEGSPASLNQGGFGSGNGVLSNQALMNLRTNAIQMDQLQRQQQAGGMGQTAAPAAPAAPAVPTTGINRDQYLALLANPGPIQPVGANPPGPGQAQTGPVGSTNAIPAFLAANKGSNTSFINTLRQMQGSPA